MQELVQHLKEEGVLKTSALIEAFLKTDRRDFVLPEYQDAAYEDYPLPIGFSQTISQPYTVAFMLELLNPRKGEKILDVGSGSGWTAALLAEAAGPQGKVYGLERIPELVRFARENLAKYPGLKTEIVQAKKGKLGLQGKAPFDKILVSAASEEIPQELLSQLTENGVMVAPIRDAVVRIQKRPGKQLEIQRFEGFAFVPLC